MFILFQVRNNSEIFWKIVFSIPIIRLISCSVNLAPYRSCEETEITQLLGLNTLYFWPLTNKFSVTVSDFFVITSQTVFFVSLSTTTVSKLFAVFLANLLLTVLRLLHILTCSCSEPASWPLYLVRPASDVAWVCRYGRQQRSGDGSLPTSFRGRAPQRVCLWQSARCHNVGPTDRICSSTTQPTATV